MGHVVSTIMFDGQFWILLVEKYQDDGSLLIGKHTFGPEPTHNDIRAFFMDSYHRMQFHPCDTDYRIRSFHSRKETERNTKKSFEAFADAQKTRLLEKKSERKILRQLAKDEKYELMQLKKKKKKRGH